MLSQDQIKQRREKTPEQALAALMHLCARAEKSSGDALRLMRTWGVNESARRDVLQKLLAQRFIDDERYTAFFVSEKTRLGGWGTYKIRAALQRKGIAREVIDTALAATDPAESAERLRKLLGRKLQTVKYTSSYDLRNKLMRYGLSLGYEYEAVSDCVMQAIKTLGESCDDFSEF